MQKHGMKLSAFCPDEFVLNDEGAHDRYEAALTRALDHARLLGCPALITQVGQRTFAPRAAQHAAIVKGLRRMAPLLEKANVTLLVEPLNDAKDHPGYYLTSSEEGLELVREADSRSVKMLFDVYHQVHMGEDVLARIKGSLDWIGHFHIAGHPNRDDAIFTNFDYRPVLELIKRSGTSAPVGLELFAGTPERAMALLETLKAYR
jgi:hydroxypyruvate isomerase